MSEFEKQTNRIKEVSDKLKRAREDQLTNCFNVIRTSQFAYEFHPSVAVMGVETAILALALKELFEKMQEDLDEMNKKHVELLNWVKELNNE